MHIGYIVKRYPRFSETFIVNEILAHEAAGARVTIFALGAGLDERFQEAIARVRARVCYLAESPTRSADLLGALSSLRSAFPGSDIEPWLAVQPKYAMAAARLALEIRTRGIDHLHAHFATSATTTTRLASLATGVPYSFTAHAKDIFHESVDTTDLVRKIRDARYVVTVSDYNLRYLRSLVGASSPHIHRVYNGLPLTDFPFSPPVNRVPRVLAVGRLVEKKGFDCLVDACGILRERGVAFSCDIVGAGEQESSLRASIDNQQLKDFVRLVGPSPLAEVKKMIAGAAVFAAPCVVGSDGNRDGLPTVLLEAMAMGTPCVSTDVTGIPEILRHESTGLMVDQRDPIGLADAIERILRNREVGDGLARSARALIEREFDVTVNAAVLRQLFAQSAFADVRIAACV